MCSSRAHGAETRVVHGRRTRRRSSDSSTTVFGASEPDPEMRAASVTTLTGTGAATTPVPLRHASVAITCEYHGAESEVTKRGERRATAHNSRATVGQRVKIRRPAD